MLKKRIPQATVLEVSFIRVKTTARAALSTIRLISKWLSLVSHNFLSAPKGSLE